MELKPSWLDNIGERHLDLTPHTPDWTTVRHADVPASEPIFDVWCSDCGQSGSFGLTEEDIDWI